MTEPLKPRDSFDRRLTRRLRPAALMIAIGNGLVLALGVLRRVALRLLEIVLAIVLLFEEWGWRPLARMVADLRRLRLWAMFEDWVQTLPPYPSLLVFVVPPAILLPFKLAAIWLVAQGHVVYAGLVFVGAKLVGTAFVARLFVLLQPKLMSIGWFARAYNFFMPWKEALFAHVRASWAWRYGRIVKSKVKRALAARWIVIRPRLEEFWLGFRPRLRLLNEAAHASMIALWDRIKALYSTNSSRR